ncbi:MAG TPA: polysaccharide deacetylase family protein [Rhizomicrobium sp.]
MQATSTISLAERIARKLGTLTMRRVSAIWPHGVVSFTFDDFPKSALSAGGAILERHGVRGTYYTAFGLAGTQGSPGAMFEIDDVRAAHARGHEVACHTYAHINCAKAGTVQMRSEVDANAAAATSVIEGLALANFSYPFGGVSSQARRTLGPRFSCCRGIQPGINEGVPDYTELRANKIYASLFDEGQMRGIIDRNRSVGGWLVFYTHDVVEAPSAYGCTGDQLESVVAYAASRSPILPVREVVSAMGIRPRAS